MTYKINQRKIQEGHHQRVRQVLNRLEVMAKYRPQSLICFAKALGEYYELRGRDGIDYTRYDGIVQKCLDTFAIIRVKQLRENKK